MVIVISTKQIENLKKTQEFKDKYFRNNKINEREVYNVYRLDLVDEDPGVKGVPMIFITTPMLNLNEFNINTDGFLTYLHGTDPDLLNSLSFTETGKPFITLLSNRMSEFSTADLTLQTTEVGETHYGYSQNLPLFAPTADNTNVTYVDNTNLDVLKVHKAWFDYVTYVTRGVMRPASQAITNKYIDYTASIYHFVLEMDGETIQYFDKMTGCFPTNIPYNEFSSKINNNQELIEFSIDYTYSYREYMNPSILVDFNNVSTNSANLITNTEARYRQDNDVQSRNVESTGDFLVDEDLTNLRTPMVVTSDTNKKKFKLIFK